MQESYPVRPPANREWFNLKQLSEYSGFSVNTLRAWIHRAENPLPAFQMGKRKYAVRRDIYEEWVLLYLVKPIKLAVPKAAKTAVSEVKIQEFVRKLMAKVAG